MRRQIAVRRVTRKSSAFHASRHRRSSAVWGKHQAEAEAARMSPSHWWMADSLRERHSCSLMSAESATIPPEVHHFAVLFSSFFLLLLWRSRRGIWEWGCWAPIDNIQIEGLWICVVFACVKMKAGWDVKWNSLSPHSRWNDSSSRGLKWQKSNLMRESRSACTNWLKRMSQREHMKEWF